MKTAKINLKLLTLLFATIFIGACEKDEIIDIEQIANPAPVTSIEGEDTGELTMDDHLTFQLDSEVTVQFSDDKTVVLIISGTGFDGKGRKITLFESRVINLSDRSMQGEGRIQIEGLGNIYFSSVTAAIPLPAEEGSIGYSYTIDILNSDIDGYEIPGQMHYIVTKESDDMFQETILISE
jgi:hypothetical protein